MLLKLQSEKAVIDIRSSPLGSIHLRELYRWFVEEWSNVDTFRERKNGVPLPLPLLALRDNALVGGLTFTGYNKPGTVVPGLWICALLVLPEHRRLGIASRLIIAAEHQALASGFDELFANTKVVTLYEKQNWLKLYKKGENTVLSKQLALSVERTQL